MFEYYFLGKIEQSTMEECREVYATWMNIVSFYWWKIHLKFSMLEYGRKELILNIYMF